MDLADLADLVDDDDALRVLADQWSEAGHALGPFLAHQLEGVDAGPADPAWLGTRAPHVAGAGRWEHGRLREVRLSNILRAAEALDALADIGTLRWLDLRAGALMKGVRNAVWDHPVSRRLIGARVVFPATWFPFLADDLRRRPFPVIEVECAGGPVVLSREGRGESVHFVAGETVHSARTRDHIVASLDVVRVRFG